MQNYGLSNYLPYSNGSLGQGTQNLPNMQFIPTNSVPWSSNFNSPQVDSFQNSDTSPSMETQLFSMISTMVSMMEMMMTSVMNSNSSSSSDNLEPSQSDGTDILNESEDLSSSSSPSKGNVTIFGGSQSGENNIAFANNTDKPMLVYAQKGLKRGEKDPFIQNRKRLSLNPGDNLFLKKRIILSFL
jgi:hypothetical protein